MIELKKIEEGIKKGTIDFFWAIALNPKESSWECIFLDLGFCVTIRLPLSYKAFHKLSDKERAELVFDLLTNYRDYDFDKEEKRHYKWVATKFKKKCKQK